MSVVENKSRFPSKRAQLTRRGLLTLGAAVVSAASEPLVTQNLLDLEPSGARFVRSLFHESPELLLDVKPEKNRYGFDIYLARVKRTRSSGSANALKVEVSKGDYEYFVERRPERVAPVVAALGSVGTAIGWGLGRIFFPSPEVLRRRIERINERPYLEKQVSRRRSLATLGAVMCLLVERFIALSQPEYGFSSEAPGRNTGTIYAKSGNQPNRYGTRETYDIFLAPNVARSALSMIVAGGLGAWLGRALGNRITFTQEEEQQRLKLEGERAAWRAKLAREQKVEQNREKAVEVEMRAKIESAKRGLRDLDTEEVLKGFNKIAWNGMGGVGAVVGRFHTENGGEITQWPGFRLVFGHYIWRREEVPEHTEYRKEPITIWIPGHDVGGKFMPGYNETIGYKDVAYTVPYKTWLERDKRMKSFIKVISDGTVITITYNHDHTEPTNEQAIKIAFEGDKNGTATRLKEALISIRDHQRTNKLLPKDLKAKEDQQRASL